MDWLRIDGSVTTYDRVELSGAALRHASALRLRPGEAVGLLNGRGEVAHTVVDIAERNVCVLRVEQHHVVPAPPDVTLALGVLDNRDRLEFALEKCTELGVRRIVLLDCIRSQRHHVRMDRLEQKVEAAMLQSGRAWIPELMGPLTLRTCLERFPDATVVVGDQQGGAPSGIPMPVLLLVGPEGGFAPEEQAQIAQRNPMMWRIGEHRLRTETAAVVVTAAAMMHLV